MYNFIKKREHGLIRPLRLERAETTRRIYSLQLSKKKELALSHRGILHTRFLLLLEMNGLHVDFY